LPGPFHGGNLAQHRAAAMAGRVNAQALRVEVEPGNFDFSG
jgi:hypothetical protein